MTFVFKWKHQDGSIIEFSEKGWKSDNIEKENWLIKMSALCSSTPVISPGVKMWLQDNCRLIAFSGPEEADDSARDPDSADKQIQNQAFPAKRQGNHKFFRRLRQRQLRITNRSIALACDEFFRSRGMSGKPTGNEWQRRQTTDDCDRNSE
jgi:hypothetical protein